MTSTLTTQYGVAELVGQDWILVGAQTWCSDRYYTDDLTGAEAAQAALARIAEAVPGTYRVQAVSQFRRPPGFEAVPPVVMTDSLRDAIASAHPLAAAVAEPRYHLTVIMRGERPFTEPYSNLTAAEVEHVKATAERMAIEDGHTVAFAQVTV